jgi:hypothetical protein
MPILTVNNTSYNYPDPGQEPGWGEDATAWAEAVTSVLNFLVAPGDIINSTASIQNNITVPTDVSACVFDGAVTRAANVTYQVTRKTDDLVTGLVQEGTLLLNYNPNGGTWTLSQTYSCDELGVSFSITNGGQVQYTSSDVTGANYEGVIKFSARTLPQ